MAKKKRKKNKYTNLNIAPAFNDNNSQMEAGSSASSDDVLMEDGSADNEFFDEDTVQNQPREIREVTVDDYPDNKKQPVKSHTPNEDENTKPDDGKKTKSLVDEFLEAEAAKEALESEEAANKKRVLANTHSEGIKSTDTEETTEASKSADKKERSLVDIFLDEPTGDFPVDEIAEELSRSAAEGLVVNEAESIIESSLDEIEKLEELGELIESEASQSDTYDIDYNEQPIYEAPAYEEPAYPNNSYEATNNEVYKGSYEDNGYEVEESSLDEPNMADVKDKKAKKDKDSKDKNPDKKDSKHHKHRRKSSGKGHSDKKDKSSDSGDANRNHIGLGLRAGIISVAAASVIIAAIAGGSLALYDMDKTPAELISTSVKTSSKAGEGLTFVDVNEDTDSSLTFIDADEDIDEGLTFIDADEDADEGLTFIDANEDASGDTAADETSELPVVAAKSGDNVAGNAATVDADAESTTIEVTSEMADIATVVMAGSDQELTVATLNQTLISDPNVNYPIPFTAVDESYFQDALFVGDSRLQGFGMWSGLPGTYYCATSFNISQYKTFKVVQTGNGKVPIFQALPYNAFTKIYIKVGLNEMGGSEEAFEETYAQLIAELRAMEPRAIIYIHAILPVTASKSATSRTHNNPNIIARNESLKQFALAQKAYYIDVGPVVSDETGCLKAESAADGVHMSSRYMGAWKQYLLEHAVVVQ